MDNARNKYNQKVHRQETTLFKYLPKLKMEILFKTMDLTIKLTIINSKKNQDKISKLSW